MEVDVAGAGVLWRLRARQDELVQAIFARVRGDAFDRAGAQDAEYVAGLRAAVVAAVEYGLHGIERGEESVGPVPGVVVAQARRAARVGVSLETVLRRYVAGYAQLESFVMEEAERDGHPDERGALRVVLRAQAAVLDRLLEVVTREYRDELACVGRSPQRRRLEQVRRLLGGGGAGERLAGAVERAGLEHDLGYELEGWHLAVIAVGAGAAEAVREIAAGADRRLLSVAVGDASVWAWLGGRVRPAFAEIERGMGSHPPGVLFAVGEPARDLRGWRLTHRQAQAALVVALSRPRPFTRYRDVALLASALKDEMLAGTLAQVYLAPLDDGRNRGAVLRATLRAYLAAECNVSSAAVALNVARSTVEERLRTVEARLARTLHPCPPELAVALCLEELAPAPELSEISIIG